MISWSPSVDIPPDRPWPRKSNVITPLLRFSALGRLPDRPVLPVQREAVRQHDREVVVAGQVDGVDRDTVVGHQRPRLGNGPCHTPILREAGMAAAVPRSGRPARPASGAAAGRCGRLVRCQRAPAPADRRHSMPVLDALISAIRAATIEVIDLTARLDSSTPVIRLPEPFGNTESVRAARDQPVRRARARRGTGTTSPPASTPAPTSTRRCTGSPAGTARTSPRCR